ncbi:hypothetical protein J25TS5_52200 [Paenibacillus faecis]|nr:hypothetical protein J25TS5_52200 [Paenibacillus faecis]
MSKFVVISRYSNFQDVESINYGVKRQESHCIMTSKSLKLEIILNSTINRLTDLAMVGIIIIIKDRSLSNNDTFKL